MDTLAISEELMAAGMPEQQAKVIAKTQVATAREAAKELSESVATKADLAELKADMMRFSVFLALGTLTLQTGLIAVLLMLLR